MVTEPGPAALSATAVHKAYGGHVVLNGIDLVIPAGSAFALLGPNGGLPPERVADRVPGVGAIERVGADAG